MMFLTVVVRSYSILDVAIMKSCISLLLSFSSPLVLFYCRYSPYLQLIFVTTTQRGLRLATTWRMVFGVVTVSPVDCLIPVLYSVVSYRRFLLYPLFSKSPADAQIGAAYNMIERTAVSNSARRTAGAIHCSTISMFFSFAVALLLF